MKKILLLIAVLFAAGMTAYSQVNVTFSVDMSVVKANGYFDPLADTVRVSGSFNGWSTTATDLTKGTGADSTKYSAVVPSVAAGTINYKFIFSSVVGVQWENDPNRSAVIAASDVVLPTSLFNTS